MPSQKGCSASEVISDPLSIRSTVANTDSSPVMRHSAPVELSTRCSNEIQIQIALLSTVAWNCTSTAHAGTLSPPVGVRGTHEEHRAR